VGLNIFRQIGTLIISWYIFSLLCMTSITVREPRSCNVEKFV